MPLLRALLGLPGAALVRQRKTIGVGQCGNVLHGLLGQARLVRAVVADKPSLVELLRQVHRLLRLEPQLRTRHLLQRDGGERRRRTLACLAVLEAGHGHVANSGHARSQAVVEQVFLAGSQMRLRLQVAVHWRPASSNSSSAP